MSTQDIIEAWTQGVEPYTLEQVENSCDWFDTKEQRWRTLDQQVEEDLKLREAQELLDHARRYDY